MPLSPATAPVISCHAILAEMEGIIAPLKSAGVDCMVGLEFKARSSGSSYFSIFLFIGPKIEFSKYVEQADDFASALSALRGWIGERASRDARQAAALAEVLGIEVAA